MGSVYRVVQIKSGQEMNRPIDLAQACVLWVKYPGERQSDMTQLIDEACSSRA